MILTVTWLINAFEVNTFVNLTYLFFKALFQFLDTKQIWPSLNVKWFIGKAR